MARDFDGTNDNITVNGTFTEADTDIRTLFVWFDPDALAGTRIVGIGDNVGAGTDRLTSNLDGSTSRYRITQDFDGTNGQWSTTNTVSTGSWQNCGFAYDRGATANDPVFVLDGTNETVIEIATPTGTAVAGDDRLRIGETGNAGDDYNGRMAFVAIWNVALSVNEIQVMNRGVNPFVIRHENLILYWPLWGNQSPEPDYSGNGENGTLAGTTKGIDNPPVQLLSHYL